MMQTHHAMPDAADVCLVLMPYAALERPSIALAILKASLVQAGISTTVFYADLKFAEEVGVHVYDVVCKSQSHGLAGEWTFSRAAFPDFQPDHNAFFEHTLRGLRCLDGFVQELDVPKDIREILWSLREQADGYIDRMARAVLQLKPRIVGCSSTFQQHCASLALLRRIKELSPDVVTMIGGANCEASMGAATHRGCEWVDFVVSGEAEELLPQLCQDILRDGKDITRCKLPAAVLGPVHRQPTLRTLQMAGAPLGRAKLQDMNASPMPDYDDYFAQLHASSIAHLIRPGLLIETSRGCWWGAVSHCTFCGLNGESMGFRSKDQQRVIGEFKYLADRYDLNTFEVVDNILDMKYFDTMIPALADAEQPYDIFYETKSNLRRDQLQKMAAAGIRWLQPGIESLDDTVLKLIAKGTTARQNLQLMKWAQEEGIFVLWILLYDVPGETDDIYLRMAELIPLITHLQPPSGVSFIQYNRFSPYQMRPQDFNIKIDPDRAYSFVYPWDAQTIGEFAYFFDDYSRPRDQIEMSQQVELQRPGLAAVRRAFLLWQQEWSARMHPNPFAPVPAMLVTTEQGDNLEITDTRRCRVAARHCLSGLARQVYEVCDQAHRPNGILRHLAARSGQEHTWAEVAPHVADLCARKLMLELDGYYFSLAMRGPLRPLPHMRNYPGGRIVSATEARASQLFQQAHMATSLQLARFL